MADSDLIRVLAFVEASTLTGPVRNLIRFACLARQPMPGLPRVQLSVATFCRMQGSNQFLETLGEAGIDFDIITEKSRFDTSSLRQIRRIVRDRRPDIIQTHAVKSHFLIWLSRLGREYPWLAFHHGYTAEDFRMRMYNCLDQWSLPSARRVVTVCGPFAEDLISAGVDRRNISVLPNSVEPAAPPDPNEVGELRRRLGILPEERVILSIGRFSREKAQADLVPAAAWLARASPDLPFRIVLAGDGIERARVERLAESAGFAHRFLFAGHRADVRPLYGLADMFALPSHSEGSPNVLLEAMAFGVPIAATRVGGVPETVEHNSTALLINAGDALAMGAAMLRILSEPGLAASLATAARESVLARFSPDVYRTRLTSVYCELLSIASASPGTA